MWLKTAQVRNAEVGAGRLWNAGKKLSDERWLLIASITSDSMTPIFPDKQRQIIN